MAENSIQKLPNFNSLDELVEFFDSHDFGDEIAQMPEVDFDVNLKQRAYLVALDIELADKLTAIARAHHTSSEELVNNPSCYRAKVRIVKD